MAESPASDLSKCLGSKRFGTVLADPPWRFANRTGKVAPEHRRLSRYGTLSLEKSQRFQWPISLPSGRIAIYGFRMRCFPKDCMCSVHGVSVQDEPDLAQGKKRRWLGWSRGWLLFPQRHRNCFIRRARKDVRTLPPGRSQVNLIASRKREHSRKPDEQYDLFERCSWGPYLELFGRGARDNWTMWEIRRMPATSPIGPL